MRIVAGRFKGQRLHTSSGSEMRPTLDRVRESIFNVISHGLKNWEGSLHHAFVLDVFAGTGSLGLETLSRGAAHATFIDNSSASLAITKKNAARLGMWQNITLLKLDANNKDGSPGKSKSSAKIPSIIENIKTKESNKFPVLNDLDRYMTFKRRVIRQVNSGHPSASDPFLDQEFAQLLSNQLVGDKTRFDLRQSTLGLFCGQPAFPLVNRTLTVKQ